MSIIYEALKKSQKTRAAKKSMPKIRLPEMPRLRMPQLKRKEVILLALIFSAFFIMIYMMKTTTPPGANSLFSINEPAMKASPVAAAQQRAIARLKLEGVFLSENERLAMINHRTYHEGDNINGMMVTSIALDRVTLQNKSRSMVLRSNVTDID